MYNQIDNQKSIVDVSTGIKYILDAKTNRILTYMDRYGNIYNKKHQLVDNINNY